MTNSPPSSPLGDQPPAEESNHDDEESDNNHVEKESDRHSAADEEKAEDNQPPHSPPPRPTPFEAVYSCRSSSNSLENGNQIRMPQSALARLMMDDQALTPGQPMLFQISNPESGRVSHCGVSEFTAEEGNAHVLSWMMENLQLKERDEVRIKSVRLERGSYVKLQPHSVEFFASIRNLKDALEASFNHSFFCVTTGDTILISHWGKEFYLNVVETRPGPAVSLVDTDCEVEFDTPLDYKEPEPEPKKGVKKKKKRDAAGEVKEELLDESKEIKFVAFTGNSRRLSGETGEAPMDEAVEPETKKLKKLAAAEDNKAGLEQGKFVAFSGSARRLSGVGGGVHQKEDSGVKVTDGGKMEKKEGKAESSGAKNEPCKPFTGRKYTLMD